MKFTIYESTFSNQQCQIYGMEEINLDSWLTIPGVCYILPSRSPVRTAMPNNKVRR